MPQLIISIIIAILVLFYLYLRKELKKENSSAMSMPNLPAISEDANLPVKSEDINLPASK